MNYQHVLTHQKVKQQRDELLADMVRISRTHIIEAHKIADKWAAIARAEHNEGK